MRTRALAELFFNQAQVEKLHDFEEDCVENLTSEREYKRARTSEERLYRTSDRTEQVLQRVNELSTKDDAFRETVHSLETRIVAMEERQVREGGHTTGVYGAACSFCRMRRSKRCRR